MNASNPTSALFTDLYELTMAQAYWQAHMMGPATFSLFFRKCPKDRGYMVFAGLEDILSYLQSYRFDAGDLERLEGLDRFHPRFLDYLGRLRFTGSVRSMNEGTLFFAGEPVLEVTAPIIEAQLVETFILNQVHAQTMLATKAARVVHAARDRQIVDFAARRTYGVESANNLARLSYMVGFAGTSNTMAGVHRGIPLFGTMAHSFVTCFESEAEAFRQFMAAFPAGTTLLVDTYDTLEGVKKAIQVALSMKDTGHCLQAIRLDSGDLADLARRSRILLDEAGLPEVRIFASGGLDEFEVESLLAAGAPIDGFGVGSKVGVSADAPCADCAYKLVEYAARPVLKLSEQKQTLPGRKQVFRCRDDGNHPASDVIACAGEEGPARSEPLLSIVMQHGLATATARRLNELRTAFACGFAELADGYKRLKVPEVYPVRISDALSTLRELTTKRTRCREELRCDSKCSTEQGLHQC